MNNGYKVICTKCQKQKTFRDEHEYIDSDWEEKLVGKGTKYELVEVICPDCQTGK